MFIVSYFVAVYFKEIVVSAPRRLRDGSAETCRNCVQDFTHRLINSICVGVTWVTYVMFNVLAVYASCDSCGIVSWSYWNVFNVFILRRLLVIRVIISEMSSCYIVKWRPASAPDFHNLSAQFQSTFLRGFHLGTVETSRRGTHHAVVCATFRGTFHFLLRDEDDFVRVVVINRLCVTTVMHGGKTVSRGVLVDVAVPWYVQRQLSASVFLCFHLIGHHI